MSLVLEASVLVGSGVHAMTREHLRADVYDGKGFEGDSALGGGVNIQVMP